MANNKPALGRGLSALLESASTDITNTGLNDDAVLGNTCMLPLSQIEANPFQPRDRFEKEALLQLAESIRLHGVIQPVSVRKLGNDRYELISGERRFKAAQLIGLDSIPAFIRVANDQAMLEMALVENIQREDLDAMEIAYSYQRLIDECKLTQEQMAMRVGKNRSTVTNYLRLLRLPAEIQLSIRERRLSMGHARALMGIEDDNIRISVFRKILKDKLSVRDVEEMARDNTQKSAPAKKNTELLALSPTQRKMRDQLALQLRTKLLIKKGRRGSGRLVISFKNEDELDKILAQLNGAE